MFTAVKTTTPQPRAVEGQTTIKNKKKEAGYNRLNTDVRRSNEQLEPGCANPACFGAVWVSQNQEFVMVCIYYDG